MDRFFKLNDELFGYVDEPIKTKLDYHFSTCDWNNDGDVYTILGCLVFFCDGRQSFLSKSSILDFIENEKLVEISELEYNRLLELKTSRKRRTFF